MKSYTPCVDYTGEPYMGESPYGEYRHESDVQEAIDKAEFLDWAGPVIEMEYPDVWAKIVEWYKTETGKDAPV